MQINQIQRAGPKEYIYEEIKSKSAIDFENYSKAKALNQATGFAKNLMYNVKEDEDAANIIWNSYAFEKFDVEEIEALLSLLTPDNMFCMYMSPKLNEEKEKNPDLYQKEYWYSTYFKKENFAEEFKERLTTILPPDDMALGVPTPNHFMPSPENLKCLKLDLESPAVPKLISEEPEVWFKQDDSFNQPIIYVNC